MASELKSRKEIKKETVETDRNFTEEDKKQDAHQKDAQTTEKALSAIDSAGTREGHDQRVKAAQSIDQSVKREADKLKQAERKLSETGKKAEGVLDKTARTAEKDESTLRSAQKEVKFEPANKELGSAADSKKEDKTHLDTNKAEREKRRTKSDEGTDKFHGQVKGLKFKVKGS